MEVAQLLEELKKHADEIAEIVKDARVDSIAVLVSKDGYKDVTAFIGEDYESFSKFSYSKEWEYAKRKRRRFLMDTEGDENE